VHEVELIGYRPTPAIFRKCEEGTFESTVAGTPPFCSNYSGFAPAI
jgi:hypothetical protein